MADIAVTPVGAIPAPRVFHPGDDDKGGFWESYGLTVAFDFSATGESLCALFAKTNGPTRFLSFDLTSGTIRWQQTLSSDPHANVDAIAVAPNGRRALVPSGAEHEIALWDLDTGQILDRKLTDGDVVGLDWHPGGEVLAVVAGKNIEIWQVTGDALQRQRVIRVSRVEGEWPLAAGWSPDGTYVAIGTNAPGVCIGKADGTVVSPVLVPRPEGSVSIVEWSSTGDRLASASLGNGSSISIWQDPRMAVDSPFEQKYALITAITLTVDQSFGKLTWDPSGQMLAVGDSASNLRIYDASSGALLTSVPAHPNSAVIEAHWRGDRIITVGAYPDQDFRIWRVQDLRTASEARVGTSALPRAADELT